MLRSLLLVLWLSVPVFAGPAEELFLQGNGFMDKRRYQEAHDCYQQAIELAPDTPSLLYNCAQAAYFLGKGEEALKLWSRVLELEPDDWRVRTKLIQCYQLLGDLSSRQREEQRLVAQWKKGDNSELKQQKSYTMDQFRVGSRQVLTRIPFEPDKERRVLYIFVITKPDSDETEDYYLSLGTYELDTQMGLESGHLKPGQRYYHLDEYRPRGHATHEFVVGEPDYETVKQWVTGIVAGTRKPYLRSNW